MMVVLALIVTGIIVFYRALLVSTFDPGLAVSVGIAAWAVHYGLMTVLSLTIVASFEAVGAILAVAFLILPGATARLWTHKLAHMLWFSFAFGIVTSVFGYWLSHPNILNTSAGAAMVTAGFGLFLLSWLLAPRAGLISRWLVRRRLQRTIAVENLIKTIGEMADAQPRGESPAIGASRLSQELKWTPRQLDSAARLAVQRGWIRRNDDLLRLTPAGIARGRRLEAAHLAWESYLQKQLGLPADHVHDAAEWIEHYLEDAGVSALEPARANITQ
jgi:Mn-dependent DtxR family transcriptional regulator